MNESATLLTTLGTMFQSFTTWMGQIASTIAGNELFLLPVGIFVVGGAIGLVKRLLP